MSAYEPLVAGSFMRRSASASSNSSFASCEQLSPTHKMEPVTKLQSRGVSSFPAPHKTQLPARLHYPSQLNASNWHGFCQRNVWPLVGILVFCFLSLYAFSLTRSFSPTYTLQKVRNRFGIVIDAGSSGSRLHIYKYRFDGHIPQVDLNYSVSRKVSPGLSSFAPEPDSAGDSLFELVKLAKQSIPEREWPETRLYLMATAGLRLVETAIRNRILDSCRGALRKSPFLFEDEWASVISGSDEGKFAWVAANYVLGTLGRDASETFGIVELGGASAQVTFVPDSHPPTEYLETLDLGGVTYNLYIHSFLKLGQEAAFKALFHLLNTGAIRSSTPTVDGIVIDPCTPKGYERSVEDLVALGQGKQSVSNIRSAGNFDECRKAAFKLLQQGKEECKETCAIGSIFIPHLRGKFFGTENFFYTSEFFHLPVNATLKEIQIAGEQFCEEDWSALQQKYNKPADELQKYCFSTSYIVALLHDSLGIDMEDESIKFANTVGKVSLDWALGAIIVRLSQAAAGGAIA
eukprot:TRINITY_DN2428_c0_g2_i1.p1 TRINITY_DN2428_c0_g2~~TRINITY_DN2428_c0_g2_i1.p1  ORF type:complete len:519 (+),score=72.59 TRINITY_DN2428_c0_g2_i1:415-1971(+)